MVSVIRLWYIDSGLDWRLIFCGFGQRMIGLFVVNLMGLKNLLLCVLWLFVDMGFHFFFWASLGRWVSSSLCFPISWWRSHRFLPLLFMVRVLFVCLFKMLIHRFLLLSARILLSVSLMLKNQRFLLLYLLSYLSCFCFLAGFLSCCVCWDGVSFFGGDISVFIILLPFIQW